MVVRLVRAGVGALLLLIAVPLGLAGGGLWVAMEHRAADDTFTARLERLRSGGRAVVVPDIDALLRADAPFARGGQTTLNLSAVGSSGPLFIGLAPDTAVQQYLDGLVQARVSRVRLAQGPLPVELTEIETRAAAASAGATAGEPGAAARIAGPVAGGTGPAVAGPGVEPGTGTPAAPGSSSDPANTADPNTADPNTADPAAGNPADPNAGNPAAGDTSGAGDPGATGGTDTAIAMPLVAPGGQEFWLAKSITVDGAAQLTWSPSALRGRHLALVVMNADGTAGINATVTARLAPAWIGPTAGGLLMLSTALFLLALLILAWPQRRAEERLVLPTLPSQPSKGRGRLSLRRNLSTLSDPIAALLNPVVPKNRDAVPVIAVAVTSETEDAGQAQSTTTIGIVVTEDNATGTAAPEQVDAAEDDTPAVEAANGTAPVEDDADEAPGGVVAVDVPAAQQETGQTDADEQSPADDAALSELDRPAPAAAIDDDEPGPVVLPPLPKLPAIELQFTWAPVAVDEQEEATASS